MTQEEKAKAYDEALEKAREWYNDSHITIGLRGNLEDIFPELKESKDNRIMKVIRGWIYTRQASFFDNGISKEEILAWLEKQGEQESIDPDTLIQQRVDVLADIGAEQKLEPKFKVGDWLVFNNKHQSIYQVEKIEDGYYILRHTHGGTFRVCVLHDESLRLWTIQDAKDGDVLCCERGWTCIFKILNSDNISFSSYCFMDNTGWFCETGSESHTLEKTFIKAYNGEIYPATKEQRDILFQKMKKEGYVWDSQEKELRKVKQNPTEWSDEDERNIQNIDSVLFYDKTLPEDICVKLRDFLKTLKDRVGCEANCTTTKK